MVVLLIEDDQKDHPTRPEASRTRRRTLWGTLRISMSRERSWGSFSLSSLHVPVFSEQLHPAPFILRAARSLCHCRMPQLVNDVVHGLRCRFDRRRAGRTAETAIAGPLPFVEIEVDEGNVLDFDVFPNIDFRPIQQRMDPDMSSRGKSRLELIPELRRLIAEIPIAMFVTRREVAFLGPRPFLICAHTENDARIALLLNQLLESIGFQSRTAVDAAQRMIHPGRERFLVLPHDQFKAPLAGHSISIFDHGRAFVTRGDVPNREMDTAEKCL